MNATGISKFFVFTKRYTFEKMKVNYLALVGIWLISCQQNTHVSDQVNAAPQEVEHSSESDGLEIVPNANLVDFLNTPLDRLEYKSFHRNRTTSTVVNKKPHYYNPKLADSIYYKYIFISEGLENRKVNTMTVFKFGTDKHLYDDTNEVLIALDISHEDNSLRPTKLIGLTTHEILDMFGNPLLEWEKWLVYSHEHKVILFKIDDSQVSNYKFVRVNSTQIDTSTIEAIILDQ